MGHLLAGVAGVLGRELGHERPDGDHVRLLVAHRGDVAVEALLVELLGVHNRMRSRLVTANRQLQIENCAAAPSLYMDGQTIKANITNNYENTHRLSRTRSRHRRASPGPVLARQSAGGLWRNSRTSRPCGRRRAIRTGGTATTTGRPIEPGGTLTLAELQGPGMIAHFWCTIAHEAPFYSRLLTLRMYWDGEEHPSVECPIGDFFGIGHGVDSRSSRFPSASPPKGRGRNCYWPMPFRKSARITVTNESDQPCDAFLLLPRLAEASRRCPTTRPTSTPCIARNSPA